VEKTNCPNYQSYFIFVNFIDKNKIDNRVRTGTGIYGRFLLCFFVTIGAFFFTGIRIPVPVTDTGSF
jgi:hypothetical protein